MENFQQEEMVALKVKSNALLSALSFDSPTSFWQPLQHSTWKLFLDPFVHLQAEGFYVLKKNHLFIEENKPTYIGLC